MRVDYTFLLVGRVLFAHRSMIRLLFHLDESGGGLLVRDNVADQRRVPRCRTEPTAYQGTSLLAVYRTIVAQETLKWLP